MPLARYREWKKKNATIGCRFARLMAGSPPGRYGYRVELVHGNNPGAVAASIANRVAAAVTDPAVNGLGLVLDGVLNLSDLVHVADALARQPQWNVSRSMLRATPIGDVVAFRIARDIPFGSTTCPSESLVLGPFPAAFPATRCAPVTALEIYTGNPPPTDFNGNPTKGAHLALVNVMLDPPIHKRMTVETAQDRLDALGGINDLRAKAKVAFSVPLSLAAQLGCVPT